VVSNLIELVPGASAPGLRTLNKGESLTAENNDLLNQVFSQGKIL